MPLPSDALAKLASSGLDEADADLLGITRLSEVEAEPVTHEALPALRFAYYDRAGVERTDVYRLRILGEPPPLPFGAVRKKTRTYTQPVGSAIAAYWPRSIQWTTLPDDAEVVITEGELKAACACKHGIPTIGLGGVWNFCSKARGYMFLPELASFNWSGRRTVIAFDSDATSKEEVAAALQVLSNQLVQRGAIVCIASIPHVTAGSKTGVDDYVVAHGAKKFRELLELAEPLDDLMLQILAFNTRYAVVKRPACVYDELKVENHAIRTLVDQLEVNKRGVRMQPNGKLKEFSVSQEWLKWTARRTFEGFTYAPGGDAVIDEKINGWKGWGVEPVPGDVSPWTKLLDHLFTGALPLERLWFEQWCAFPLQHPGKKMNSTAAMWSKPQGVGKSTVGEILVRVYGNANAVVINQKFLESGFNKWAVNRQFVMIDDLSPEDSQKHAAVLKPMITEHTTTINDKFISTYEVPAVVNYFLTSNHPDAFRLDEKDRRFFIHEVTVEKLPAAFYRELNAWLVNSGPSHLFHHLLNLDLTGFDAYGEPPCTDAKQQMIDLTRSPLNGWVADLANEPDLVLRTIDVGRDLYTAGELSGVFETAEPSFRNAGARAMAKALRHRFQMVYGGKTVKSKSVPGKYWCVRRPEVWLTASHADIVKHIDETRAATGSKKF